MTGAGLSLAPGAGVVAASELTLKAQRERSG
jgi:hypothetical protein